jgi:phospholipase D1/2
MSGSPLPVHPPSSRRPEATDEICVPGRNCWTIARADRVAFLVDADAYFRAFAEAVAAARETIFVIGWDIQAAMALQPGTMPNGWPATLREYLDAALAARPSLQAYLLDWDFSFVFALEREALPVVQLGWRSHPRLHFSLDAQHPLAGCHHQKIVVVDDTIAFSGGLDLTTSRWDTSAHRVDDPGRRLPNGKRYGPFHDVQIAVSGDAARRLGSIARARWTRATGERVAPSASSDDAWPSSVMPDLTDVDVAIARTEPAFEGRPALAEVEALYCDSIAAARRSIYLENQYFTSGRIAAVLAERLAEPDGPEVVMVVPRICSGWLEERTMGVARARLVRQLRDADAHGHFRIFHPRLAPSGPDLNVHAKVMIVDDALARVGSSNLSNRSMGLDTECDVAIDAHGEARIAAAVAGFRDRLLGEHLGVAPSAVADATRRCGSLIGAVERLAGGPRTLVPLDADDCGRGVPFDVAPVDLERPVAHAPFVGWLLPPGLREPFVRAAVRGARALVGVVCTALAWRWAGLGHMLAMVPTPAALAAVSTAYLVGAAVQLPIAALQTVSVLALGPARGILCATAGAGVTDVVVFALGAALPRRRLARLAGRHFVPVIRMLVPGRVRDVAIVRLSSAAPFPTVGMVAGASSVPLWRFLVGTLLVAAVSASATAGVACLVGA